jgi:hypothetical protein
LDGLNNCIQTINPDEFEKFTKEKESLLIISFDIFNSNTNNYPGDIQHYLEELDMIGTLSYLITELYNTYKDNNRCIASFFSDTFQREFREVHRGRLMIIPEFHDIITLPGNNIFINRDSIKKAVYNVFRCNRDKILLIEGQSRLGSSYLENYFSEVSTKFSEYDFISINIQDLAAVWAESARLQAVHVAKKISDEITLNADVNTSEPEKFKLSTSTFTGKLRSFLDEKAEKEKKKYLFFFHQFNDSIDGSVHDLISAICDMISKYKIECYVVLSGYQENHLKEDLRRRLNLKQNKISINNFDTLDVQMFYRKIYLYMQGLQPIEETWDELWNNIEKNMLTTDNMKHPNVEKIGDIVSDWYYKFITQ